MSAARLPTTSSRATRSFSGLLAFVLTVAVSAAVAQDSAVAAASADPLYTIGPEDVVEISVWKEEGLKKEVLVRPDGGGNFPLIGDLQVAGKTVSALRDEITVRLDKFIPDPVVSVAVLRVGSHRIFVIGRVNKPGDFTAGRYLDVLQALALAGGFTPYADKSEIRIMRRENGRQVMLPFDYSKVSRGENLEQNVLLRAGDVVVVP